MGSRPEIVLKTPAAAGMDPVVITTCCYDVKWPHGRLMVRNGGTTFLSTREGIMAWIQSCFTKSEMYPVQVSTNLPVRVTTWSVKPYGCVVGQADPLVKVLPPLLTLLDGFQWYDTPKGEADGRAVWK